MSERPPRHAAPDRPPLESYDDYSLGRHALPDEEPWLEILEPHHRAHGFMLYLEYDEAFQGYASEIYPDIYQQFEGFTALENDFTDHYIGSYDDLKDWAKQYVDEQGWTHTLKETMRREGIPEDFVEFDYEPLLAMVHDPDNFQIVWGETKVHLFFK